MLSLLGIHLAQAARQSGGGPSNIAAANAVEAPAVWRTFQRKGWVPDARLPGFRKLYRFSGAGHPIFARAASGSYYVSQPLRIGTRDALPMLALVTATTRCFNGYAPATRGHALLEACCPDALRILPAWLGGGSLPGLDPDVHRFVLRLATLGPPTPSMSSARLG